MSIVKFLGLGLWLPDYWSGVNWHLFVYLIYKQSFHFGEGSGTPLQCSCLENPMDGGAWWAAVHGVSKSWT